MKIVLQQFGGTLLIVFLSLVFIYGSIGLIYLLGWLMVNHLFLAIMLAFVILVTVRYKI